MRNTCFSVPTLLTACRIDFNFSFFILSLFHYFIIQRQQLIYTLSRVAQTGHLMLTA